MDKFWPNVNKTESCWLWTGAVNSKGYGIFYYGGKNWVTHRLAYEKLIGAVPEGLELDHRCRQRNCCRPDHLEPVTHKENMSRGKWASRTHCKNGHEFSGDNLIVTKNSGRKCRECTRVNEGKKNMAADMRQHTFYDSDAQAEALKKLAQVYRRSVGSLIREAIRELLEKHKTKRPHPRG